MTEDVMEIKYDLLPESERRQTPIGDEYRDKVLSFGQLRSDHMFVMDYEDGEWGDFRIVPYGNFEISPGAMTLHYGQAIFEGAKAFKHEDGEIYTWRIDENAKRMNKSAEIMCMPEVPEEMQVEAIEKLIQVEKLWCPDVPQSSLYIRPYMYATEDFLGVKPSSKYRFAVLLSPSGPYYAGGFTKPVKLLVTKKFHRAVAGGTGSAKACGNYAASLRAAEYAHSNGAAQVLYLDATNTYIEEVGAMNHFHIKKDGTVVIPTFTDTILRSITSLSIIDLADRLGRKVVQETVKLDDFLEDIRNGEIIEAGGFGTAAVISPVGQYIMDDGETVTVADGQIGEITKEIYNIYTKMQTGKEPAPEGWLRKV